VSWFFWLTAAVVVTVLFVVVGLRPRGARPAAGSHLMGIARVVLLIVIVVLVYLFLKGRGAG
jgi:hypothetical protein